MRSILYSAALAAAAILTLSADCLSAAQPIPAMPLAERIKRGVVPQRGFVSTEADMTPEMLQRLYNWFKGLAQGPVVPSPPPQQPPPGLPR
jgi:hypothetical protein